MEGLPEDARYRRTEDFIARTIAGETVLVPLRQRLGDLESIYTMNEVATFIWERLAEPSTLAQVAAAVVAEFDGDPGEIHRDVEDFLGQLVSLRAVRPVGERPDVSGPMPPREAP